MLLCKQTQPLLSMPPGGLTMVVSSHRWLKEKVVSRLSIDLATRFPAEIVNSDKMQVYEGLHIITNKITEEEQRGAPHHHLGIAHPNVDFTAPDFRDMASLSIESILGGRSLPIIFGGSNSYIDARYECCFLWVDVSRPVLHTFVSKRVDKMVDNGMVEEAEQLFYPNADYTRGIRRPIGVPELDLYFQTGFLDEEARARVLQEAVHEIKANTFKLACCQLEEIHWLKNLRK
ncbi:hypothetical protein PVL29_012003 [Vitis rotundifolia]|uniref:Uncharacterized protein n=1 Tax=Vitis rotundifolia TaxID=103349 RepID=A0AA38ZPX6_VITRO|nr:hypothetical protein PVL29_012003 [Vitis rotundifolia]